MAQVDEIVDAIQDAIEANYKAWNNKANRREELKTLTEKTFPAALSLLEKRLTERGGQFMVGNSFSWADLHFFYLPQSLKFGFKNRTNAKHQELDGDKTSKWCSSERFHDLFQKCIQDFG